MAEILAALAAVGPWIASAVGFAGTAFTVIQGAAVAAGAVVSVVVTVLGYLGSGLLLFFLLPFQWIVGFFVYPVENAIQDFRRQHFDQNPPRRRPVNGFQDFVTVMLSIGAELRGALLNIWTSIAVIIPFLPGLVFLFLVWIVILVITYFWYPFSFLAIQNVWNTIIFGLNTLAATLNMGIDFLEIWTPVINSVIDFGYEMAKIFLRILCPNQPYTGNGEHDCPLAFSILKFFGFYFEWFESLVELFLELFGEILKHIGEFVCPGNTCDINLCEQWGITDCEWNWEFIIHYFARLVSEAVETYLWILLMTFYLIIDVVNGALLTLGNLFTNALIPRALAETFRKILTNLGISNLANLVVPSNMVELKGTYLTIGQTILAINTRVAGFIAGLVGIVEALLCNVLRDTYNCFGWKLCKTVLYDLPLLPLRQWICIDELKMNPESCPYTCDHCPLTPFGTPVNLVFWYREANIRVGANPNTPQMFTPFNLQTGCVSAGYSLLHGIFS